MGRGEQLAPRRADGSDLQGWRQERSRQLPPDHLPPNDYEDGHPRHPQEDEEVSLWQWRKKHPRIGTTWRPVLAGMQGVSDRESGIERDEEEMQERYCRVLL